MYIFRDKGISFDDIIYKGRLGGEFAINNYITMRRNQISSRIITHDCNDESSLLQLTSYLDAFEIAENVLASLLKK